MAVVRVEVCVTKYFPLRVQGCSRAGNTWSVDRWPLLGVKCV